MADEGMDPCECIWSHEMAMRRLLSILRQGQTYCTDNECLEDLTLLPNRGNESASGDYVTLFLIMALVVALFVMRPRTRRDETNEKATTSRHSPNSDGAPPTPPPATN